MSDIRRVTLVTCEGTLRRDRTSYGHQWSVDMLEVEPAHIFSNSEDEKVKVTIEIERMEDE